MAKKFKISSKQLHICFTSKAQLQFFV